MKQADKKVCVCENDENIVKVDTIKGIGTELETLDGFYCAECNSFWREP